MMLILSVFLSAGCGSSGSDSSAPTDTTAADTTPAVTTAADTTANAAEGAPLLALIGLANDVVGNLKAADTTAPTVTAVVPLNDATGVAINTKTITAAFSEPMDSATLTTASFTLACPGGNPITGGGAVTYLLAGRVATLPLPAATNLPPSTVCTATITTAAKDLAGNALASNFVWTFKTGVTPDTTRPRVISTLPATTIPGPTTGAPTNTAITAIFSEDMDPATITAASFTLTEPPGATPVAGVSVPVTYVVGSRTATFTPAAVLKAGTTYTATITTAATDIAGNQLAGNQAALPAASNYVWTFTTAAAVPPVNISVLSTSPADGAGAVCPRATINATFNVPSLLRIDLPTLAGSTLTGPAGNVAAKTLTLDTTGRIITFTALNPLVVGTYTITIKGGADGLKDTAMPPNTMVSDYTFTFTVVPATGACLEPPDLGAAWSFGNLGGTAGTTNQGILTVINGDIGSTATVTSAVTGLHDFADIYTETGSNIGTVNGHIYTCTTSTTGPTSSTVNDLYCMFATSGLADAQTAYGVLAALPVGANPGGNLGGLTLAPGVYTAPAPAGSFLITGSDLTLNGGGDVNAVFIFRMASTLHVGAAGAPRSIILINGAQAKNVFWQVGSSATINAAGGGTMAGTILAHDAVLLGNVEAVTTLDGRAVGLNASVTMTNTVINVPAP